MAKQRIIPIIYKVNYSELDKSTLAVKKAEKATEDLNKDIKETGNSAGKSFANLKNAIIATGIIGVLTTVSKKIFDLGVNAEQTAIAFNTLTGSAQKGQQLLAQLTKFSIVTPFTPDQVNKAAKALLSFGVQAEQIIPTLKILGDVSSGTGKDLTEMAIIFGQIRSTGRLMGQDLLQLINAGFNPLQVISEETGKSVGRLKKEMESGLITFEMVENAFKKVTSEGGLFFNLMEKQSVSVGGKLSTFAGNLEEVGKSIFALNNGPINDFVDKLVKISEALMDFFKTPEQRQFEVLNEQFEKFDEFAKGFDNVDTALESYNATIRQNLKDLDERYKFNLKIINQEVTLRDRALGNAQAIEAQKAAAELRNDTLRDEIEVLSTLMPKLQQHIAERPKEVQQTKELTEAEEKLIKQRKKARQEALDLLFFAGKGLGKDIKEGNEEADKKQAEREEENRQRSLKNQQYHDELRLKNLQRQKDLEYEILEADAERRKQLEQDAFEFGIDLIGGLLTANMNSFAEENAALDAKYDEQLRLAGDNDRAKQQIEMRRAEEEKRLRARQFDDEKRQQTRRILIETVLNAVKALGLPPIPGANFIAAAKATAYGLLSAGLARKYSKGSEVGIDGPGTTTSDSIPAMLSRGETVMSYDQTEGSKGILKAIKARKLDDKILEKIYKRGTPVPSGFTDERIVKELRKQKFPDVKKIGSMIYDTKRDNSGNVTYIKSKYYH